MSYFGIAKLALCLSFKLNVLHLDGDDCHHTFTEVFAKKVGLFLLQDIVLTCVLVENSCHCTLETHFVSATLYGGD